MTDHEYEHLFGWMRKNPTWAKEIAAIDGLRAELAAAQKDAERYRWMRLRLEVRNERALSGRTRPAICTRVGQSFLDTETRGPKGYTDPNRFAKECEEFDAAIDEARKK